MTLIEAVRGMREALELIGDCESDMKGTSRGCTPAYSCRTCCARRALAAFDGADGLETDVDLKRVVFESALNYYRANRYTGDATPLDMAKAALREVDAALRPKGRT